MTNRYPTQHAFVGNVRSALTITLFALLPACSFGSEKPTIGALAGDAAPPGDGRADTSLPPPDGGSLDTPPCQPIACVQPGGNYCGDVPDGCGKILPCGDCPAGQLCGAAGTPHVCGGDPSCQPISCSGPGYKYCGNIGDGCGRGIDCGGCPTPQTCGGGGTPNVCGP